jgi:hypothetical protein
MRLITPFAPNTFLRPVIVIDTVYVEGDCCETAVLFNNALNANHGLAFAADEVRRIEKLLGRKKVSTFIPIKQHASEGEAIAYHLAMARQLKNGGTDEQWAESMPLYNELYEKYCPDYLKDGLND